jgi:prepilin-type N-terminal cleavage/methylation domain-containing protein
MGRKKWAVGGGQWAVKSPRAQAAPLPVTADCPQSNVPSPTAHCPLPTAHSRLRRGITLIELLVTMAIIAIISTAILGTARGAMENARRSRTRATIAKIHGLIMDHWDTYANRRVDVKRIEVVEAINNWADAPGLNPQERSIRNAWRGQMMADARLLALRELMKMEMPDRWSDVINQGLPTGGLQQPNDPDILAATPALARTYFRFLRAAEQNTNNDVDTVIENQQAECLYLTVIYATGDGEARTMFPNQDIGDTDDDGAPEFLDGWGQPIRWIRWAPGFGFSQTSLMTGDGDKDHDPFDILRRDSPSVTESPTPPNLPAPPTNVYPPALGFHVQQMRNRNQRAVSEMASNLTRLTAFRLVPLIWSNGPDDEGGIVFGDENNTPATLDPYAPNDQDDLQLGQPDPDSKAWRDNLHNQLAD